MSIFQPTKIVEKITDVTPELLRGMGVKAVLLDVDNTLTSYKSHEPVEGAVEWTHRMTAEGFQLLIVSNNYQSRVEPFAAKFGIGFITFAMKPLPFGYVKAKRMLKMKASDCVIIGDQVFTDITGANMSGMKSILLSPVEQEDGALFKLRRRLERSIREKYK